MMEEIQRGNGAAVERAEPAFEALDRRAIALWRVVNLVGSGVMLLMAAAVGLIWWLSAPEWLPVIAALWLALAVFSLVYSIVWPPREYRNWGYRIDQKVLETRSGVVFHITRLLPLNRLQHVDLERGPFERMYGLASLVLHTAGTQAAAITIPGLDAGLAARLRDHLVEIGGDDAV